MAIKLGGSGGISIPIGSSVDLLDTANTVTRGGETFLKNGQLSNAATYPNAPVRNFIRSGTLATQSYGSNISPWGGLTTVNICKVWLRMKPILIYTVGYVQVMVTFIV